MYCIEEVKNSRKTVLFFHTGKDVFSDKYWGSTEFFEILCQLLQAIPTIDS
jgi:hypothetical protein